MTRILDDIGSPPAPPPGIFALEEDGGDDVEYAAEERAWRPRTRRRSRSRTLVLPAYTSAPGEVDLNLRLSGKAIAGLSEEQKSTLRAVVPAEEKQVHFKAYHARGNSQAMVRRPNSMMREALARDELLRQLPRYAEPIPTAQEFMEGIGHRNNKEDVRGQLWDVARAIASAKVHYLPKIQALVMKTACVFAEAKPDLSTRSDGNHPLSESSWIDLKRAFANGKFAKVDTFADYMKHILHKHDGEARLVGDAQWEPFSAYGEDVAS